MSPSKIHPALLGGLFIGVLSALPFVSAANCCCLWLMSGGLLAAYVMQQNHPAPISLLDGAAVGLFAGLFGFVVMVVASLALTALHVGGVAGGFEQFSATSDPGVNPEVSEMLRRMDPRVIVIAAGALFVFVGLIASTVGGAVGAALFRRSAPPPPPLVVPPVWGPPPSGAAPPTPDVPPVPSSPPGPTIGEDPDSGRTGSARSGPDDPPS